MPNEKLLAFQKEKKKLHTSRFWSNFKRTRSLLSPSHPLPTPTEANFRKTSSSLKFKRIGYYNITLRTHEKNGFLKTIIFCARIHLFYKQLGSGLKAAHIFKVFGAQSCLMVT